jgi:preprotein translocase subunit YajC
MEMLIIFLILLFVFVVFSIYMQRKLAKGIGKQILSLESNTQIMGRGILGELDPGKDIELLAVFPAAGTSLEGISFYDFIEARNIEMLKKMELKNADVIVANILEKIGFQGILGQGFQIVASIKHVMAVEKEEVLITFTKEAMDKLKLGSAAFVKDHKTGLIIPQLRDLATGEFMEHGKLMHNIKSMPALMRQVGTGALPGLIAMAHIISNYDINKRLRQVGKNLEFLKSARLYDQKAELIANFGKLQQAFSLPEPHRTIELARIHFDLKKLRNIWSMEIEGALRDLRDTRPRILKNTFIQRSAVSLINQQELKNVQERLTLMGYSARLDSIAIATGIARVYREDELLPLEKIGTLLKKSYAALPSAKIRESVQVELDTAFEIIKSDSLLLFPSNKEIVYEVKTEEQIGLLPARRSV